MAAFNKYYENELSFLRELGREFAAANPKLAGFLAAPGADPDVERLMEGVAFLTGRLREKLDDELPELTHELLQILWPHYLRPSPSASILQFTPLPNALNGLVRIRRGAEVDSLPVEGSACRFRTCFDVDMLPLSVRGVAAKRVSGGSQVAVAFQLEPKATLAALGEAPLRLYLGGGARESRTLYLWLRRYLKKIRIRWNNGGEERDLPISRLQPAGFEPAEALLDYPAASFAGYRVLQEYFTLPDKFLFLDLHGLGAREFSNINGGFEVQFDFDHPLDEDLRLGSETFQLFCTPIVNLFSRDADPVRLDHTKTEYRIRPASADPAHYEIFSIDAVEGLAQGSGARTAYHAFEAFQHGEEGGVFGAGAYYRTRKRPAIVGDGFETYASFISMGDAPQREVISLSLTCTNRNLPEKLKVGEISVPTGSSPEIATFRNVTKPTPSVTPPLDQGLHWLLISNLSLNYVSLLDVKTLRALLGAYDFRAFVNRTARRESELRLEGLRRLSTEEADFLVRGRMVRGVRTVLEMQESQFASEGEMFLFASILAEFFALYVSINSAHELIVRGVDHGEEYRWPIKTGRKAVL
ncbi:MAG: type VI secretion system baseplate subunit TssF [Pseudomonadota bacterium]